MGALRFILVLIGSLFLGNCGKTSEKYDFRVALDPSWYSNEWSGREAALTAFSVELIEAVGNIEKLSIGIYRRNWNDLIYGLERGQYEAICSIMQPYLFYEKLYTFSDLYLMTGPVVVTSQEAPSLPLEKMGGKIIGIEQGSQAALVLEKYPQIIQRTYGSIQQAFIDITTSAIDAAITDILTAEAFTHDLFQNQLKITTPPLTKEGLRLVALQGRASKWMEKFNRGLKKLKANGTYTALAKKWKLAEPID
jgi:polar amino acid transport system substrate-binding protein